MRSYLTLLSLAIPRAPVCLNISSSLNKTRPVVTLTRGRLPQVQTCLSDPGNFHVSTGPQTPLLSRYCRLS